MEIKTKRLLIREIKEKDIDDFCMLATKEISYHTRYIVYPLMRKEAEKIIKRMIEQSKAKKRRHYELVISLKGRLIGMINIYDMDYKNNKCKLGFWVGEQYRRRGYTFEACIAIMDHFYNKLKMHKISATSLQENTASNELLKKLGFSILGIAKQDQLEEGKYLDSIFWEKISKKCLSSVNILK